MSFVSSSSENPLISIGMSVYNCETTVGAAIQSILKQTFSNFELIVIDDGSKDKTATIVESIKDSRIRFINDGTNKHLPARLNQAIELSRGKYFARMDGDDISFPFRLEKQAAYLEKHPHIDLLSAQYIAYDALGNPLGRTRIKEDHRTITSKPWSGFPMPHILWMGKIEWFRKHKYNEHAIRMEDFELLLRSYRTSTFAVHPEVLSGYRVDAVTLKKTLTARKNIIKAVIRYGLKQNDPFFGLKALAQIPKGAVDTIAVYTNLQLSLLKHRKGSPLNEEEIQSWKDLYRLYHS
jgi:glycosyltransferase involved in cell wall biosynthesis